MYLEKNLTARGIEPTTLIYLSFWIISVLLKCSKSWTTSTNCLFHADSNVIDSNWIRLGKKYSAVRGIEPPTNYFDSLEICSELNSEQRTSLTHFKCSKLRIILNDFIFDDDLNFPWIWLDWVRKKYSTVRGIDITNRLFWLNLIARHSWI